MLERSKHVWMFNSGDTFTGNPKWLFVYVSKFRPDIKAYWLCETEATARYVRSLGYKAYTFNDSRVARIQARTGVYVVNQVKERIPDELRGAVFLNLWHGVGVKRVERNINPGSDLEEAVSRKYIRNNLLYRNNQLYLATSKLMEENFSRQLGLDETSIIRGGYPANIYPKEIGGYATYDHDIVRRQGLPPDTRIALYAPTWRTGAPGFLRRAFPDMGRLVRELERTNTLLIFKVHPHMSKDPYFLQLRETFGDRPNLLFWDNEHDVYEIFPKIDLGVVDYSSILYDLMAAGVKNFIRYVFDFEDSKDVVAEDFDYYELSCGAVASSFTDLIDALGQENRVDDDRLAELNEMFWGYSDEETLARLVDRALEYEIRDIQLPTLHTFDVFDTVIHRHGVTPASVFHYVKQRMEMSDRDFPRYVTSHYPAVRAEAEASERDLRRRQPELVRRKLLEIRFDEIHERIASVYGLTKMQSDALKQWELEGELLSVVPDIEMIERIREIQANGNAVSLVSDMYLPRAFVMELLEKADPYLATLPLYLSSDTREQKSTRSLYLKIYRELGYDFAEWIHHGDSPWGDVKQADAMAITVDQVPKTSFDSYEAKLARSLGTYDGYLFGGMLRKFRLEADRTYRELFAFAHVGSYWVPYVDWALADAVKRGYRTLYFISRDGYHLKRIADELIAARGLDLRTMYIYGSRTAWRVASQIDSLDDDLFEPHGDFLNVNSVDALLTSARLDRDKFAQMFPELATLTDSDLSVGETRESIVNLLSSSEEFRDHLLKAAAEERDIAVRYLRQEVNLDEPFGIVEYWGSGYTQTCLARLMVEAAGRPIDTPVYYYRAVRRSEGHAVRHLFTVGTQSPLFVEAIFANHPHGTVLGYREDAGRVAPIVEPRQYSVELHEALEELLPEYARRYAQLEFVDQDRAARDIFRYTFGYYARKTKSEIFVRNLAPLYDSVHIGAREQEFAPGMTREDLKRHKAGESFRPRTRSMPLSLARSSEWVRVNYVLHTEDRAKRPTWVRAALLGRAFVRTAARRAGKRAGILKDK